MCVPSVCERIFKAPINLNKNDFSASSSDLKVSSEKGFKKNHLLLATFSNLTTLLKALIH